MGIQGFYNFIKNHRKYNKDDSAIVTTLPEGKTYDFLFFDFQSGIYGVKNELQEYDYLIRLIYYIKFKLSKGENILYDSKGETKFKIIIDRIYLKFKEFIGVKHAQLNLSNDNTIILATCDELIASFKSKTIDNFLDYYVNKTFENTLKTITKHGLTNDKVFVFFDGVPSIAKLKEQLLRRIEPNINTNIVKNLYDTSSVVADKFNEKEFIPYLSSSFYIPIGLGTPIINKLIEKFNKDSPSITLNDTNKYGEAEHQIMRYIENNGYSKGSNKFTGKNILLSSPDSDLILLSFIMNSKGYKMDLLRYEFISENSYLFDYSFPAKNPYFEQVEYILIEQLIKNILTAGYDINSTVYNKLMDISYILLILGDDFLPTIPNINVKNIDDIISVYNEYIKEEGPGRKLVNKNIIYYKDGKYLLNFEGFKKFLEKMAVKKIQISRDSPMKSLDDNKLNFLESRVSKNLKNANEDYDKAKNYYFITETSEIVFKKKFFYNKGIVMNDSGEVASYKNLLTINKTDY